MIKKIIQLILILAPIVIFCWLLILDIAPFGIKNINHTVGSKSAYINDILPIDRTLGIQFDDDNESYNTIVNNPVYFNIDLPNTKFDEMEVTLEFNNIGQPVIELGGLVDIFSEGYILKPLENLIIEDSSWNEIKQNGLVLLQRNNTFHSIDEFLENMPDISEIAVYNYNLPNKYRLSNYVPLNKIQTFNVSLRGYHKYKTYIKNEDFYLEIQYMDMNRTVGPDGGVIRVWNEDDEIVLEQEFKDDGNEIENQISNSNKIIVRQSGLPEGVYSVELSGTSDIFWRTISTSQRYMTFVEKIFIGDDVGYSADIKATSFYTNAKHLTLETYHADAAQNINLGSERVAISSNYQKVEHTINDAGVVYGSTLNGDIKIIGDGKFSFSKASFFDSDPVKLNSLSDLDILGVDYVIADYNFVEQKDKWKTASAIFDIDDLYVDDNSVKMTISTPYIRTEQGVVEIHAINIVFKKDKMSLADFLSTALKYIPGI